MPKLPTNPTLLDECLTINITDLKKWGYLLPGQFKSGTLKWSHSGTPAGSISIRTCTNDNEPYLELDYKTNGNPINYRVSLVSVPSNLGIGEIWYFRCPHTEKRCRKLYLVGCYFLHRKAFKGCMYRKQTRSKRTQQLHKTFYRLFQVEDIMTEIQSPYFKTKYRGKPTKLYQKLNKM